MTPEASLGERNAQANRVILSGDMNGDDGPGFTSTSDNALGVIQVEGAGPQTQVVLDELTLSGGLSGLKVSQASLAATQCVLRVNPTAAITANLSTLALNRCTIDANGPTGSRGYALDFSSSQVAMDRCTVTRHYANVLAMVGSNATLDCRNTLFAENGGPGAKLQTGVTARFTNCTFAGSAYASLVPFLTFTGCTPVVRNCIFWNTLATGQAEIGPGADVAFSCVQGGYPGEGNTSASPGFAGRKGSDYRLPADSPSVNVGSNAALFPEMSLDLDGKPRIVGCVVDQGAYEAQDGHHITVTQQPRSGQSCHDRPYRMCVVAAGEGLRFQWDRDGAEVEGATTNCIETSVSGVYRCRVWNDCGSIYSNPASLTIRPCGFGDLDGDNDVDQSDFGLLQACLGPASASPLCGEADLDGDDSVGASDIAIFTLCHTGAGAPLRPDCRP